MFAYKRKLIHFFAERQWDIFTSDKEQCLERMKAECNLESEEEREKRDKQLMKDIEGLLGYYKI